MVRSARTAQRGRRVIFWPDTFTNHFEPEVGQAAVEVLETQGFRVELPGRPLCCGRPLYDYGMLPLAKRFLRQILDAMGPQIAEGVPVVGLEPSCVAVFRDELVDLFPHDHDAVRLSRQTFTLGEFLERKVEDYQPPRLERQAIVQGHCHHKAVMGLKEERSVMEKLGLDFEELDSGCCGMAGSFGYEKEKYDVSIKAGERVLLPAVREAAKDTLVIADGFSCRSQISDTTDRRALHLAQVIQMALHNGGPSGDYPESAYPGEKSSRPSLRGAALLGTGAALTGGALVWRLKNKGAR